MKVIALQSGSNGNCVYVEAGDVRLLFDAGISGTQAQRRLAAHGRDIADVNGLVISHDHRDHARCLGVYHRKFGLPVHITKGTLTVAGRKDNLGTLSDVRYFQAGCSLSFNSQRNCGTEASGGNVTIETIPTPHDAADGVAFVVDDGTRRLGILTDLGHAFDRLFPLMKTLDAVLIESNYDPEMLANGPYQAAIKRRIRGPTGHLSNADSAQLLLAAGDRLRWACLAHLSEENNDPNLAIETHRRLLGDRLPLFVASRYAATGMFEL